MAQVKAWVCPQCDYKRTHRPCAECGLCQGCCDDWAPAPRPKPPPAPDPFWWTTPCILSDHWRTDELTRRRAKRNAKIREKRRNTSS